MLIRFLNDEIVKDGEGRTTKSFRAGQIVELSNASAQHWLRRQKATEIAGKAPVEKAYWPAVDHPVEVEAPEEEEGAEPEVVESAEPESPSPEEQAAAEPLRKRRGRKPKRL